MDGVLVPRLPPRTTEVGKEGHILNIEIARRIALRIVRVKRNEVRQPSLNLVRYFIEKKTLSGLTMYNNIH